MSEDYMARVRAVKAKYEARLLQKANVVGVGIGLRMGDADDVDADDVDADDGCDGDRPAGSPDVAIIVNVTHKVPAHKLSAEDRIPEILEGVPVQVQAVGKIRALKKRRRMR